jgi:hypothetical protein
LVYYQLLRNTYQLEHMAHKKEHHEKKKHKEHDGKKDDAKKEPMAHEKKKGCK